MIKLKRVYEKATDDDGFRILVERLWPRGIAKDKAHIDLWLKDISPSPELRKWYGHDIAKWNEFQRRYRDELSKNDSVNNLKEILSKQTNATFIYAARDEMHNSALVLKEFLENES